MKRFDLTTVTRVYIEDFPVHIESSFTPAFPSLFQDRFSCLKCEGFDIRAEARLSQPAYVILHLLNL